MDRILLFIENNLNKEITNSELADLAGYSVSAFTHRFKTEMNESVQAYICRRRLLCAAEEILNGEKIIDVAFKYNWQSHSAFTKSFRREFGFTPSLLKLMQIEVESIGGNAMEKIFIKNMPIGLDKETLFEQLINSVHDKQIELTDAELKQIYNLACEAYKGITRYSGEEYVTHPINVAIILAEIEASPNEILAGLLCDVQTKGDYSAISERLAPELRLLVEKLNDGLSEDIQLIKLAERVHNMRTIDYIDDSKKAIKAKESLDVYMPIAREIGNQKLIDELNDLSLKYS